jgi:outer membrane protein assembly factor BamB
MEKATKLAMGALLLSLTIGLVIYVQTAQSAMDFWPMFHHDLTHAGYSTSSAPNTNQTVWTYATGNSVYSSPAVVGGVVYVGSYDRKIYALNAADGTFKWNYTTGGVVESSPAVVNGVVYVGSDDNKTYALNAATGTLLWSYLTGGNVISSPAVVGDVVYVGSLDKKVYALNATNGASIWNYTTGDQVASSPAIVDGRLYAASNDFKVYCINASTGALIWNYATYNSVTSSPVVADGRVHVGSYDASVYCLNASTGARIWQYADVGIISSPAVANGRVYIGQAGAYPRTLLLALNATTGASIWNFTTGASVVSSPAVADGKVFVGSTDMKIYALNESTGELIWSYRTGSSVRSSPAVSEGGLFVGSDDGKVYAFGAAPPTITLSPTAQAPGASVSVAGTGFTATKAVAIGFGVERSANDSNIAYSGSGVGPWTGRVSSYPIKPGSFLLTSVVVGVGGVANHTDNGDGTLSSPSQFFASGTINYVTGEWSTIATMDISMFDRVYNATYTRYQYDLTSAVGITTNSTGGFTATITIPSGLANGNYNVTAIDTSGNLAVATLNVNSAVPEDLPFGATMLLASAAVAAGSWQLRKRPRILK